MYTCTGHTEQYFVLKLITFTLAQEPEVVGDDLLAVPAGETEYILQ